MPIKTYSPNRSPIEDLTLARVRQDLPRPRIVDIASEIERQMKRLEGQIRPGMSVAVTAGSRGICSIPLILRQVAQEIRRMGGSPFIVSAMGSHGGGTATGQESILRHLGITEDSVGTPFRITSESVAIGETESGHTLFTDAEAWRADAILAVNRIKPHTAFRNRLASGLFKMLTVGLGKEPGATQVHRLGASAIHRAIVEMGRMAVERLPVLGGVAIVENGYEETARLELLLPHEMEAGEERLLVPATELLPGLPVRELDLLIVDEMGKDFSGTGMDTNVIGRWKVEGLQEPDWPRIERIVVLALSRGSEGNANGLGLADFTTRRLVEAIDWSVTLTNVRTTGFWRRAHCPPFPGNDREAVEWALRSLRLAAGSPVRAARIRNTLSLEELWLSPAALGDAKGCTRLSPFQPLAFDSEGVLLEGEQPSLIEIDQGPL